MKNPLDLETACEKFKQHLATVVAKELRNSNLNKGLRGLNTLTMLELKELKDISQKSAITSADIDRIITAIVRRDSPAEFAKNHENLSDALEKYRAVSDLLKQADNKDNFRKTFEHHKSVLLKTPSQQPLDQPTVTFFNAIKPALVVSFNQDRLYKTDPFATPEKAEVTASKKFTK